MSQDGELERLRRPIERRRTAHEEPKAPVRDDTCLAVTEDLDRDLDGVPHDVVGFTALFSVLLAVLVGFMVIKGHALGSVAGVVIALVAIPVLVTTLRRRADRGRDHAHPSR
jgi:hypothetical protein